MLTFESLLVKELQRQQSRAEFCDIVLHTQGVSVPVHSCVLSAFSPWLCGALSTMPPSGQKRLVEVQAKEGGTLLSLVTLLYSGQMNEDKEEVLSAAGKLGISIPQRDTTEVNQQTNGSQAGTQTEPTKESVERECQTEFLCNTTLTLPSECPNPTESFKTVNVIDLSSWRADQGLDSNITLTTLQGVPEKFLLPSVQVADGVPETSLYPTVSALACVPESYLCPPERWSAPPPPHPYPFYDTCNEPLAMQSQPALGGGLQGQEYGLEGLEQFENNIPGFINCFLKANTTQALGKRQQTKRGMRGEINTRRTAPRARQSGICVFKSEGLIIRKTEQYMQRFGRAMNSVRIGQGGGRVGRMLDTRQVLKHQGRINRRQGVGVQQAIGERGRPRKRQAGSIFTGAEIEDEPPPAKRKRGRPRKHPLPSNSVRSKMSSSKQQTIIPPAPSMMHTAAPPLANQTGLNQPLDWLIDDVIAQLPLMPQISSEIQNSQEGVLHTSSLNSHQKTQIPAMVTDFGVVRAQPEGELTDMLDNILKTFEQQIAVCDLDVWDEMPGRSQRSVSVKTKDPYQHSAQNTSLPGTSITHSRKERNPFRASTVNTKTIQNATASFQNRLGTASSVNREKLKGHQNEKSESHRITRSQSRKRKLDYTELPFRREMFPAKGRRRVKKEGIEKPEVETSLVNKKEKHLGQQCSKKRCSSTKMFNVVNSLGKVMQMPGPYTPHNPILDCSKFSQSDGNEESNPRNKQTNRNRAKNHVKDSKLTNCTFTKSHPETHSAFELMQNLLENQRKKEDQKKKDKRTKKEKMLVYRCVQGAKLPKYGRSTRIRNQSTSQQDISEGPGSTLIKNPHNKPAFDTVGSSYASSFQSNVSESSNSSHIVICSTENITSTNFTAPSYASPANDPVVSPEEPGHTQTFTDNSEEDVDVVEISSSFSESSVVQPLVADIVLSTDEEDEEDAEIEVLDSD